MSEHTRIRRGAGLAGIAVVILGGCAAVEPPAPHKAKPAIEIVKPAEAGAPKTLTLTPDAIRRLEIATAVVEVPTQVPWSAVIYDKKGAPWVYTSPKERTFIRMPLTIEHIDGDVVTVSAGPPSGTAVVTRAAIKLYGAENGVGGGH